MCDEENSLTPQVASCTKQVHIFSTFVCCLLLGKKLAVSFAVRCLVLSRVLSLIVYVAQLSSLRILQHFSLLPKESNIFLEGNYIVCRFHTQVLFFLKDFRIRYCCKFVDCHCQKGKSYHDFIIVVQLRFRDEF